MMIKIVLFFGDKMIGRYGKIILKLWLQNSKQIHKFIYTYNILLYLLYIVITGREINILINPHWLPLTRVLR